MPDGIVTVPEIAAFISAPDAPTARSAIGAADQSGVSSAINTSNQANSTANQAITLAGQANTLAGQANALAEEANDDIGVLEPTVAGHTSSINNINSNIIGINNNMVDLAANTYPMLLSQRIMGNALTTGVARPSPIDLDDGGLFIIGGKIQVGDTYGKVIFIDPSRTDSKLGKGTVSSPYNGSTPDRIDAIMKTLYDAKTPANVYFLPHPSIYINPVRIHDIYPVVPSVFNPWYLYNGLRIHGFGKGRTVFKPADVTYPALYTGPRTQAIFRSSMKPEDDEFMFHGGIYNCTMDGGVTSSAVLPGPELAYKMAFDIVGGEVTIDGVEIIRFGGRGQEMFPFILRNGQSNIDGSIVYIPARRCFYRVRNCSSDYMYHNGGNVGGLINGPVGGTAHQMCQITNNRFLDMYITWAQFNNVIFRDNFMQNVAGSGVGNGPNLNCDTGINYGIKIIGNTFIGAISAGVQVGSVTLGSRKGRLGGVQTMICSDIVIKENTFKPHPNAQDLFNPGVLLSGNCYNWNVSDNFYQPSTPNFTKHGFISAAGIGNAARPVGSGAGNGFGSSWLEPEDANSQGIMFNNQLIEYGSADHGKTPLGMENYLVSDFI